MTTYEAEGYCTNCGYRGYFTMPLGQSLELGTPDCPKCRYPGVKAMARYRWEKGLLADDASIEGDGGPYGETDAMQRLLARRYGDSA